MQPRSRYVLIGLVTLVLGLIVLFPARVGYQWFAPPGVALSGIDGTIWSGSARDGDVAGLYVRGLQWRMRPLALFKGQLAFAIEADTGSGFLEGNVGLGAGGAVAMTDLTAAMTLESIQEMVGMPGLSGMLNARFERLTVENGIPVAAAGTLEIADLRAPLIDRGPIGGYRAEFFTQESGVMASVEDTDGVVDLAGSLQLSPDSSYQFIAQLAPKGNTPAKLREQMKFLGTPNERGQYEMRLEGEL